MSHRENNRLDFMKKNNWELYFLELLIFENKKNTS